MGGDFELGGVVDARRTETGDSSVKVIREENETWEEPHYASKASDRDVECHKTGWTIEMEERLHRGRLEDVYICSHCDSFGTLGVPGSLKHLMSLHGKFRQRQGEENKGEREGKSPGSGDDENGNFIYEKSGNGKTNTDRNDDLDDDTIAANFKEFPPVEVEEGQTSLIAPAEGPAGLEFTTESIGVDEDKNVGSDPVRGVDGGRRDGRRGDGKSKRLDSTGIVHEWVGETHESDLKGDKAKRCPLVDSFDRGNRERERGREARERGGNRGGVTGMGGDFELGGVVDARRTEIGDSSVKVIREENETWEEPHYASKASDRDVECHKTGWTIEMEERLHRGRLEDVYVCSHCDSFGTLGAPGSLKHLMSLHGKFRQRHVEENKAEREGKSSGSGISEICHSSKCVITDRDASPCHVCRRVFSDRCSKRRHPCDRSIRCGKCVWKTCLGRDYSRHLEEKRQENFEMKRDVCPFVAGGRREVKDHSMKGHDDDRETELSNSVAPSTESSFVTGNEDSTDGLGEGLTDKEGDGLGSSSVDGGPPREDDPVGLTPGGSRREGVKGERRRELIPALEVRVEIVEYRRSKPYPNRRRFASSKCPYCDFVRGCRKNNELDQHVRMFHCV